MIHIEDDSAVSHSFSTQPILFHSSGSSFLDVSADSMAEEIIGGDRKRFRHNNNNMPLSVKSMKEDAVIHHEGVDEDDEEWLHMKVIKEMAPCSAPTPPMNGPDDLHPIQTLRPLGVSPIDPLQTTPPQDPFFSPNASITREGPVITPARRNVLCVHDTEQRTPVMGLSGQYEAETQPILSTLREFGRSSVKETHEITDPLAPSTQTISCRTSSGDARRPASQLLSATRINRSKGVRVRKEDANLCERMITKPQGNGKGKGKKRVLTNSGTPNGSRRAWKLRNSPRGNDSNSSHSAAVFSPFRFVILPWTSVSNMQMEVNNDDETEENEEYHLLCDLVHQLGIPLYEWRQDPFTQRMCLHPTTNSSSSLYPTHLFVHSSVNCFSAPILWACALGIPVLSTDYLYDVLSTDAADTRETMGCSSTHSSQESPLRKDTAIKVTMPEIRLKQQHIHPLLFSRLSYARRITEEKENSPRYSNTDMVTERSCSEKGGLPLRSKASSPKSGPATTASGCSGLSSPPRLATQLQRGYLDELIPAGQQSERPYYSPLLLGVTVGLLQAHREDQRLPDKGGAIPMSRVLNEQLVRMTKEVIRVLGGNPVSLGPEWNPEEGQNGTRERTGKKHPPLTPRVDVVVDCSRAMNPTLIDAQTYADSSLFTFWKLLSAEVELLMPELSEASEKDGSSVEKSNEKVTGEQGIPGGDIPLVPFSWLAHGIILNMVQMLLLKTPDTTEQTSIAPVQEKKFYDNNRYSPFALLLSTQYLKTFAFTYYTWSSSSSGSSGALSGELSHPDEKDCSSSLSSPIKNCPADGASLPSSDPVPIDVNMPEALHGSSQLLLTKNSLSPTETVRSEGANEPLSAKNVNHSANMIGKQLSAPCTLLRVTPNHHGTESVTGPITPLMMKLLALNDLRIKTAPGPRTAVKGGIAADIDRYTHLLGDDDDNSVFTIRRDSSENEPSRSNLQMHYQTSLVLSNSSLTTSQQNVLLPFQNSEMNTHSTEKSARDLADLHLTEGQVLSDFHLNEKKSFNETLNKGGTQNPIADVTNVFYNIAGEKSNHYKALRHEVGMEDDDDDIVLY